MATKRVRFNCEREEEQAQIPSPTKRMRLEATHEEEEEMDDASGSLDMDASQMCPRSQAAIKNSCCFIPDPREAEVGVIERLMLVNFMCHKKLDILLSPNVNFVLGRSGSGKSAIMTAIVVGLGGKPAYTQHGSSLKQFIRTGSRSAEVIVHLRNRGSEAYRPDVYGRTIVVACRIHADGTGTYKMKGLKGPIVSNKKEELTSILDHCNIQIDNPVSLLHQDTTLSNPSAKYKFFMKATKLEQIAHDCKREEENRKLIEESIMRQESMIPEYESRAKLLEEQMVRFTLLEEMERKVQRLELELQWAIVIEIEKGIPPIEVDIEKAKGRIPRNEISLQSAKEAMAHAEGEFRDANKRLNEVVKEANTVNQERNTMHTEKRTRDKKLRDAQNAIKMVKRKIAEKTKKKSALEQRRSECIEMSQRDTQGERERCLQQLKEHQEEMRNVEDRMKTAANDRQQLEGRVGSLDAHIKDSEDQLRRLQSSRTDELQAFGPLMRSLKEALRDNQQRFRKMPKGPVGSYIRLKDYKWSTAVEQVLKGVLFCFVVDNPYDDAEFKRLANGVFRRGSHSGNTPRIDTIISSFQGRVYNVSRAKPRCPHPTVLDMLDVADVDVLTILIDQCSVDSILLTEQQAEAICAIEHQRIRGVLSAYTLDGDQILPNRCYSNKQGKLGIIRPSVDDVIRSQQADLDALKREREHLRSELRDLAAKNKHHLQEVRDWMLNQVQMVTQELQSAEEEEESQEDIATYDGEIQECEARIAALEQQRELKEEEARCLKTEQQEYEQRIQEIEAEVERVTRKMEELQANHNHVTQGKQRAQTHLKHFKDRVKELRDIITDLEKKAEEQRRRADEAAQAASEVCDRIDTQRTRKSIGTEISKLRRKLQQEEPRREESEAVRQQYLEIKRLLQMTAEIITKEKEALMVLQTSLSDRRNCYKSLQNRIVMRACMYFNHFLMQRDCDGKLRFNHDKERLEMQVKVDVHSNNSQSTKNTKSLSGGDCSYATVCFIISLWEAMEAPFRCLDEFDVFMDMLNRRISMRLMLEHAADQPNRQFIFFTPQDMSSIGVEIRKNVNIKVKVLRLSEPERGQTTLD